MPIFLSIVIRFAIIILACIAILSYDETLVCLVTIASMACVLGRAHMGRAYMGRAHMGRDHDLGSSFSGPLNGDVSLGGMMGLMH